MKLNQPPFKNVKPAGLSLVELAVVITVLLSLVWVLFIGMTAWKSGSDRSNCLVNIRNVQMAGRSYQNMYAIKEGHTFSSSLIIGTDSFVQHMPECPAGGTYTFANSFPAVGTLFMSCSVESHVPPPSMGW